MPHDDVHCAAAVQLEDSKQAPVCLNMPGGCFLGQEGRKVFLPE
jgi:hypothetical protein